MTKAKREERSFDVHAAARYEIRLWGHLGVHLRRSFPDFSVSLMSDGVSVLEGVVEDQAALFGLLRRLRDLGLPLLSLVRLSPERRGASVVCEMQRQENDDEDICL